MHNPFVDGNTVDDLAWALHGRLEDKPATIRTVFNIIDPFLSEGRRCLGAVAAIRAPVFNAKKRPHMRKVSEASKAIHVFARIEQ